MLPGANRRLGLALIVIATAQLMVVLDTTIVNVALPHTQRALGFSGSGLEWVVNAYALSFGGLLLLLGGRLGTCWAAAGCSSPGWACSRPPRWPGGFAISQAWLLAARAAQGIGGALIAPATLALIVTTFAEKAGAEPGDERARGDERRRRGGRPDHRRPTHQFTSPGGGCCSSTCPSASRPPPPRRSRWPGRPAAAAASTWPARVARRTPGSG